MKKELIPAIEYAVYEMLSSEFQDTVVLTPTTAESLYLYWKEVKEKDQYKMEDLALEWIGKMEPQLTQIAANQKTAYISILKTPNPCGGERTLHFKGDGFSFSMRITVKYNREKRKQEIVSYLKRHRHI